MKLRVRQKSLIFWFQNGCLKVNPDKFHLFLSDKEINHQVDNCNEKLSSTSNERNLGIKIDKNN